MKKPETRKAILTPDEKLFVIEGVEGSPRYKRFEMGLGWRDPKGEDELGKHCLVVAGEREDGRIEIVSEFFGNMVEILEEAVNLKDRFYIKRLWLDASEITRYAQLLEKDGLTRYVRYGDDINGNIIWGSPSTSFPFFRKSRPVISMVPVPALERADGIGAYDRIATINAKKKLIIKPRCIQTHSLLASSEKFTDIESHPTLKALSHLIWGMTSFDNTPHGKPKVKPKTTAYGNLK